MADDVGMRPPDTVPVTPALPAAPWGAHRRLPLLLLLLVALSIASFVVLLAGLRRDDGESPTIVAIGESRRIATTIVGALSHGMAAHDDAEREAWIDSVEVRAERFDAARRRIVANSSFAEGESRRALDDADASARLLLHVTGHGAASLAQRDSAGARRHLYAADEAREHGDVALDRAVNSLVESNHLQISRSRSLSAGILLLTLLALFLMARMTAVAHPPDARAATIARDPKSDRERERQLHGERAFAASLVDSNTDGLFALDPELRVTEWNPVMARWSGIDRDSARGKFLSEVIPLESPLHESRRAERLRALLAGAPSFSQERSYHYAATDVLLTVETVISPIRDSESGHVTGALCTVRDIAERRAAEQRFRLLFEHSADGHVLLDAHGIVDCNDAALRMLARDDREHFFSLSLDDLSPERQPDGQLSRTKIDELRARAISHGQQRFDWIYLRRDGSELSVDVTLTSVPLPGGAGLLLVWHDITARRAVEEAVRRERERLTDAIEALESGFAMFDAEQRLVAYNRTFARMRPPFASPIAAGMTLRQMLQGMLLDGRHPETGEDAESWIQRLESCHRGPGDTFEERMATHAVRIGVTRTRDGGSVALTTDISELVWIQRSLEAARDAELRANQAKSAFLASMSHELRTPLNSIIGFTKQVRKNKSAHLLPTDVTYLERVERNAIQLLALINSLLDLSRIEAGKIEVDVAPTELASLLRETVAQLEGQGRRPGVVLSVDAPTDAPLIEIDAGKLRQVVINLVGNALKFTHQGHVTVRLLVDAQGEPAAIEVADSGIGIPADRLEAIFRAFEQAERTTARDYGGTGLGLNISRSLCTLIGAGLEVESAVGVGTTFRVVLHAIASELPAIPALAGAAALDA